MLRIMLLGFLLVSLGGCFRQQNDWAIGPPDREELMDSIAHYMQELSAFKFGEIQIMQIKRGLEQMDYSYQDLEALNRTLEERVKSEKVSRYYTDQMYLKLKEELELTQHRNYPLPAYNSTQLQK